MSYLETICIAEHRSFDNRTVITNIVILPIHQIIRLVTMETIITGSLAMGTNLANTVSN